MTKREIDPRIQVAIMAFCGIAALFFSIQQLLILNLAVVVYLMYCGEWKQGLTALLIIGILYGTHHIIVSSDNQILKYFGFFTFLGLRFCPLIALASVLQKTPSGQLMSSLQQLRLPKALLITLAVSLRFFPMIKQENQTIQMSAKLRGLSLKQPANWRHPLLCFEYTFVPLMMRTLRISDDLAAAAMTKGIDFQAPRTSIYSSRLTRRDISVLLLLGLCCIGIAIIGG